MDVSLQAPEGLTVLFGRSGSGKTTLVNAVAGLLRPDQARIEVGGRLLCDTQAGVWLPAHKRRVGYVFQDARLFPHLTVRQNLLYGRFFSRRRVGASLDQIVDLLGLEPLLKRRPAGLSGGEQQRVALGRALLADPALLLADEPLAALDEARKAEILPYFERLRDHLRVPILYVSHAPAEVARLATTVVVLQDGRVLRQGSAAQVLSDPAITPAGVRAAGALLQAVIVAQHDDGLSELQAGGQALFVPRIAQPVGSAVRIRIRAQDVMLSRSRPTGLSALNILAGRVEHIRQGSGPGAMVSLNTQAGVVLARITRRSAQALALEPGCEAYAIVKTVSVAPEDIG
jgi:molybdate transport system ATP-binding protein